MNCEQALILISAALDGEITQPEREQLNSHLDLCAECRSLAEDFGLMSAALAEETELPAGLTGRMEEALRNADQRKKPTFLRRYGSMAAMLAIVIALGGIVVSGGFSPVKNDAAMKMAFDAKAEEAPAEAAPAEAAPVPSVAAETKGSAKAEMQYMTADSATFDAEPAAEEVLDAGTGNSATKEETAPVEPPASEHPQFDPPDHATLYAALQLVVKELVEVDGFAGPVEEDYYYCVLERTENERTGAVGELKLEYAGLSENGKYLTYALRLYTEDQEVASVAVMNNFAVSTRLDEVLREYDENRTVEHVKAYRAALSE